jgi:hypothetical protein
MLRYVRRLRVFKADLDDAHSIFCKLTQNSVQHGQDIPCVMALKPDTRMNGPQYDMDPVVFRFHHRPDDVGHQIVIPEILLQCLANRGTVHHHRKQDVPCK